MTFSRASWASSPFQGVVGTLVMLMLRCSFRTSRLYCSTWVPFTLHEESGLSHPHGTETPPGGHGGGTGRVGTRRAPLSPGQGLALLGDPAALELEVAVALVVGATFLLELDLRAQGHPRESL